MMTYIDKQLAELHARPGFYERVAAAKPLPSKGQSIDFSTVWSKNPFSTKHLNLTMQMLVMRTDKDLATKLKVEAKKLDAAF